VLLGDTGAFYPTTDSTTAMQFNKADGTTNIMTIDTTNSRVGIGTNSPNSVLNIVGTGVGASDTFLGGTINVNPIVSVSGTTTSATDRTVGIFSKLISNTSTQNSSIKTAIQGVVEVPSANSQGSTASMRGIYGYAYNEGTGSIDSIGGGYFFGATNDGAVDEVYGVAASAMSNGGTATYIYGIDSYVHNNSANATSLAAAFRARTWGTGTINDSIGFFMDNAHGTNTWGVYILPEINNYFAGRIGIGVEAPTTKLDVAGLTISTDADNTIMAANFTGSLTKNDTNLRTFSGITIKPTINTGASNTNTTFDVLKIDTTNTAVTGVTTNLISASYGGTERLRMGSGSVSGSGVDAIAGLYTNLAFSNSTSSGFQFGNRHLNTISGGSQAGTMVGTFIRMSDNSSYANVVRGIEVQAYSGTNNTGINTGIATFGKTFGLHAETTAQAGSVSQAAAVFANLNNSTDGSLGNAIRAYTETATSAALMHLYQTTSTYTGTGLLMNFAAAGSGSYSGNFMDLQVNSASKLSINWNSTSSIITQTFVTTGSTIDFSSTAGNTFVWKMPARSSGSCASGNSEGIIIRDGGGTQRGHMCIDSGGLKYYANQFNASSTDLAENFSDVAGDLMPGELVSVSLDPTAPKGVVRSKASDKDMLLGIVSTKPGILLTGIEESDKSTDLVNPKPIALSGRVPVRVSLENGPIAQGDYLTASSVPGVAAKAVAPGLVIGQALSSYDGSIANNLVTAFVNRFYYDPTMIVSEGKVSLQRGNNITEIMANTTQGAAFVVNQQGTGDLLSLQANGTDRFLVKNSGSVNINVQALEAEPAEIMVVKSNDQNVFSINSRGDVAIKGVIKIEDDSYAGSIATNEEGIAEISFTNHLGTGKPSIQLTPEAELPVFAQVFEWTQDSAKNYTGFKMKSFKLDGSAISAIVHYSVVAKQDGYATSGKVIEVVSASSAPSAPPATLPLLEPESSGETVAGESIDVSVEEEVLEVPEIVETEQREE
jgi:hypothetical protein